MVVDCSLEKAVKVEQGLFRQALIYNHETIVNQLKNITFAYLGLIWVSLVTVALRNTQIKP
ncbi:hypothetical protein HMPREF9370_1039 [Neisseria wadsworthii 9715]|uniref:Uncharacterized protein n=1 Tax=Neisseria wadsworthii 9715 TaxID=1030841 RepID=G4CPM9_9NEIS|nr:hypothetical protein HMPREF9370_1039 [Neisseria wadsworthii 9715]